MTIQQQEVNNILDDTMDSLTQLAPIVNALNSLNTYIQNTGSAYHHGIADRIECGLAQRFTEKEWDKIQTELKTLPAKKTTLPQQKVGSPRGGIDLDYEFQFLQRLGNLHALADSINNRFNFFRLIVRTIMLCKFDKQALTIELNRLRTIIEETQKLLHEALEYHQTLQYDQQSFTNYFTHISRQKNAARKINRLFRDPIFVYGRLSRWLRKQDILLQKNINKLAEITPQPSSPLCAESKQSKIAANKPPPGSNNEPLQHKQKLLHEWKTKLEKRQGYAGRPLFTIEETKRTRHDRNE